MDSLINTKYYKDLPKNEELELTQLLSFMTDYVSAAQLQKKRWKRSKRSWDFILFCTALISLYDTIGGLRKYIKDNDQEFWNIIKTLREEIDKRPIRLIRDDGLHCNDLAKGKSKKFSEMPTTGRSRLHPPERTIVINGTSQDIFQTGANKVSISEVFQVLVVFIRSIRNLFYTRWVTYNKSITAMDSYHEIVPWFYIRVFAFKFGE